MQSDDFDLTNEKRILLRGMRVQRPVTGSLELLPICNMYCDMCYIRMGRAEVETQGGLHPADEWIRLGREMAEAGVLFLLLTGGEPLLFPDFRKLYLELKRLGLLLTINTNGTLIDEEWADFFGKHKPRRINVTLYGTNENAYCGLCHYPDGFGKAVRGIRLLKECKVDVKINGSVTKNNYGDMQKIYEIGKRLDIPVHMDTYMLPGIRERGLPFEQQARLLPEDAAQAALLVRKNEMEPEVFMAFANTMVTAAETAQAQGYSRQITCLAGNCSFAVSWRGKIRPCVTFEDSPISVFEKDFRSAWDEISRTAKTYKVNETCANCRMRPLCPVCPAAAYLETGSYDGVPEYLCRYTEEQMRLFEEEVRKEGRGNG